MLLQKQNNKAYLKFSLGEILRKNEYYCPESKNSKIFRIRCLNWDLINYVTNKYILRKKMIFSHVAQKLDLMQKLSVFFINNWTALLAHCSALTLYNWAWQWQCNDDDGHYRIYPSPSQSDNVMMTMVIIFFILHHLLLLLLLLLLIIIIIRTSVLPDWWHG